jgi:hypothetical protein
VTEPNRYGVRIDGAGDGPRVVILDPEGRAVFDRVCADDAEARLFASTVEQHIGWLSAEKFRRYYRLSET